MIFPIKNRNLYNKCILIVNFMCGFLEKRNRELFYYRDDVIMCTIYLTE